MKKRFKAVLPILTMAVGIFLLASSAEASFWLKGMRFYYSPNYGEFKDSLNKAKPWYKTPKVLESGTGNAFSVGYDLGNWSLRLDTFSFEGEADYYHIVQPYEYFFRTSTSPILLSFLYRIPSRSRLRPYLGAGIGTFPSELTIISNIHEGAHYTDSPTGFQVLAGAEFRLRDRLFFSGELRHLLAKAEYPGYRCLKSCSTDWSGLFISIGIGYRFGSPKDKN